MKMLKISFTKILLGLLVAAAVAIIVGAIVFKLDEKKNNGSGTGNPVSYPNDTTNPPSSGDVTGTPQIDNMKTYVDDVSGLSFVYDSSLWEVSIKDFNQDTRSVFIKDKNNRSFIHIIQSITSNKKEEPNGLMDETIFSTKKLLSINGIKTLIPTNKEQPSGEYRTLSIIFPLDSMSKYSVNKIYGKYQFEIGYELKTNNQEDYEAFLLNAEAIISSIKWSNK